MHRNAVGSNCNRLRSMSSLHDVQMSYSSFSMRLKADSMRWSCMPLRRLDATDMACACRASERPLEGFCRVLLDITRNLYSRPAYVVCSRLGLAPVRQPNAGQCRAGGRRRLRRSPGCRSSIGHKGQQRIHRSSGAQLSRLTVVCLFGRVGATASRLVTIQSMGSVTKVSSATL